MKLIIQLHRATRCSIYGLYAAFKNEYAFRLEIILTGFIIILAFLLGSSSIEYVLLISSWLLVLIVEIINSAIETVIDRIGLENHQLSARAKDMGSAAVFLAIINALTIWALIIFL